MKADGMVLRKHLLSDAKTKPITYPVPMDQTNVVDRQKDNCGNDLLAKGHGGGGALHVEVKGTSGAAPRFFMTPNEYAYMADPRWRLAMVSDTLGSAATEILHARSVSKRFDIATRVWEGRPK